MSYAMISYSTKNQATADFIRDMLTRNHIASWMAPWDIPAGTNYSGSIVDGIKNCACVILLLSHSAQESVWVPREIERAVNYHKPIIPLQLEDIVLTPDFELYIGCCQFLIMRKADENSAELKLLLERARHYCKEANETVHNPHACDDSEQFDAASGEKDAEQSVDFGEIMYQLGLHYASGKGVPRDPKEAVKWYSIAAVNNHPAALDHLGSHYYHGIGAEQNYQKAFAHYLRAANLGWPDAQNNVAICYFNGKGVPKDLAHALEWWRRAAENGQPQAQYRLGLQYRSGSGVRTDYKEAVRWYSLAAENNHPGAMDHLASHYYHGIGVERDQKKAFHYYSLAARQGLADAQYNLALCYINGKGTEEKNPREAVTWLRKAALQGKVEAIEMLISCYQSGIGTEKDERQLDYWKAVLKETKGS